MVSKTYPYAEIPTILPSSTVIYDPTWLPKHLCPLPQPVRHLVVDKVSGADWRFPPSDIATFSFHASQCVR